MIPDAFGPGVFFIFTKEESPDNVGLRGTCEYLTPVEGRCYYHSVSSSIEEPPDRWELFSKWKDAVLGDKDG